MKLEVCQCLLFLFKNIKKTSEIIKGDLLTANYTRLFLPNRMSIYEES